MKLSLSVTTSSRGGSIGVPAFPSSSYFTREAKSSTVLQTVVVGKLVANQRNTVSFAVQESSASTVAAETKEKVPAPPAKAAPAKPKPAAKAPAKPLPELMEEDVIPPLRAILEAQDDITALELAFGDNRKVRSRRRALLISFGHTSRMEVSPVQRGFRSPPMVPRSAA